MQLLNLHKQYDYPIQLNSDGYRAPEWQDVKWNDSILLFGTSQTFGVGCDYEDTIGYMLEQKLGVPVINLSQPAISNWFHIHNAETILKEKVQPIQVIATWSPSSRFDMFTEKGVMRFGSWILPESAKDGLEIVPEPIKETSHPAFGPQFYTYWNYSDSNVKTYNRWSKKLFNSLWDCKITDFAYGDYDSELFESNKLPDVKDFLDKSNDGIHGGRKTNKYIADLILKQL